MAKVKSAMNRVDNLKEYETKKWLTLLKGLSAMAMLLFLSVRTCPAELRFHIPSSYFTWDELDFLHHTERANILDLNGDWHYKADGKTGVIPVPSSFTGFEGTVKFEKNFDIPNEWEAKSLLLRFLGIHHHAAIFINGSLIGTNRGSGLPFDVTIPETIIKFGAQNSIAIEVDNRRTKLSVLPLISSVFAPRNYGGISREIYLQALSPERIASIHYDTNWAKTDNPDEALADVKLQLKSGLILNSQSSSVRLRIELFNTAGKRIFREQITSIKAEPDELVTIDTDIDIQNAHFWKPEDPYRYRLVITLSRKGTNLDQVVQSIWLNYGEARGNNALTNLTSKPVRGITYVAQWENTGIAASKRQIDLDLELILDLNVNVVRCAYYTPHPYFLEQCDSLGLQVFVEIPLFGVSNRVALKPETDNAIQKSLHLLMEMADRHPSISALGLGSGFQNEIGAQTALIEPLFDIISAKYPLYIHYYKENSTQEWVALLSPDAKRKNIVKTIPTISLLYLNKSQAFDDILWADQLKLRLAGSDTKHSDFFVSYLSDWDRDRIIVSNPPFRGAYTLRTGLCDINRRQRVTYFELQKIFQNDTRADKALPRVAVSEPPWEFLVLGFIMSAIVLWVIRADKLFRQNLRRSFAHLNRFVIDIRDRRFLYGLQTLLLSGFIIIGLANTLASIAHGLRVNPKFCALLEHLVGSDRLLDLIRSSVWIPFQGMIFFILILIAVGLSLLSFIKIGSPRKRSSVTLLQGFYLLTWSAVPILIVLPLSALYIRVLSFPFLLWMIILVTAVAIGWAINRLIKAVTIAYHRGFFRSIVVCIGVPLLILSSFLIYLETTRLTLSSIGYIFSL